MYNPQNTANLKTIYSAPVIVSGEKPHNYRGDHEKPCKECGEFIGLESTGICMRCERKNAKPFFDEK